MKLSVHAVPHQSFLAIGSEVPIAKKSSFPPGEAKEDFTYSPKIPQNHNHLPQNPSVSPYGLPAPLSGALLGERIQPPLKGEEGRA